MQNMQNKVLKVQNPIVLWKWPEIILCHHKNGAGHTWKFNKGEMEIQGLAIQFLHPQKNTCWRGGQICKSMYEVVCGCH